MNESIAICRYSFKNMQALIKSSVSSTFNSSNLGKCKFVKFLMSKFPCVWYAPNYVGIIGPSLRKAHIKYFKDKFYRCYKTINFVFEF